MTRANDAARLAYSVHDKNESLNNVVVWSNESLTVTHNNPPETTLSTANVISTLLNESNSHYRDSPWQNLTASPTSTSIAATNQRSEIIRIALSSLLIILSGLLVVLVVYIYMIHVHYPRSRRRVMQQRPDEEDESPNSGDSHNNKSNRRSKDHQQRRYETIENWLITKRVQVHNETCTRLLQLAQDSVEGMEQVDLPQHKIQLCDSLDTADTTLEEDDEVDAELGNAEELQHEQNPPPLSSWNLGQQPPSPSTTTTASSADSCSICFSRFKPNQLVSWSCNPSCRHVYHHVCIKEWLLRKSDCPFCRQVILPLDQVWYEQQQQQSLVDDDPENRRRNLNNSIRRLGSNQSQEDGPNRLIHHIHQASRQHLQQSESSYFCMQHGLVRIPHHLHAGRCTLMEEYPDMESMLQSVPRAEKQALRGRQNLSSRRGGMDCDDDSCDDDDSLMEGGGGEPIGGGLVVALYEDESVVGVTTRSNDDGSIAVTLTLPSGQDVNDAALTRNQP